MPLICKPPEKTISGRVFRYRRVTKWKSRHFPLTVFVGTCHSLAAPRRRGAPDLPNERGATGRPTRATAHNYPTQCVRVVRAVGQGREGNLHDRSRLPPSQPKKAPTPGTTSLVVLHPVNTGLMPSIRFGTCVVTTWANGAHQCGTSAPLVDRRGTLT